MSSATFTGLAATPSVPAAGKYKLYLKNDGIAYTLSSAGAETSLSPPVSSVFGRTGAVAAATNDYTWAQINKATSSLADITTKSHTALSDIGTNTHAQLDTHAGSTANPHSVTKSQVGLGSVENTALSTWAGSASLTTVGTLSAGSVPWSLVDKTVSDLADIATRAHTSLSGLTTTDAGHTQFGLLAGRAGGQALVGGTAASENLQLQSTANAARGVVEVIDNLQVDGQGYSTQQATETPAGTTIATNWNLGNSVVYDFGSASGNVTATLTNPAAGASYVIKVIQGATPRTLTFSPVPKWPSGTGPTISTANDAVDVISLYWDGAVYYGTFSQNFS